MRITEQEMREFFEVWTYTGNICHGRQCFNNLVDALNYVERFELRGYRCELNRLGTPRLPIPTMVQEQD